MTEPSRVAQLEALIQQARHDYYNGTPTISDDLFDAWVDELSELKADSPAVTAIGSTPVGSWPKVAHSVTMGSLDKVQTLDEMTAWIQKVGRSPNLLKNGYEELVVTEKLDGLSVVMRYVKGKFVQALTRGDGAIGEDISSNVIRMKGVLKKLPKPISLSVRGEILLLKEDHQRHFPDTSNPRNTASGTSKRLDGRGSEHLTVMVYQVFDVEEDLRKETEVFHFLEELGFQTPKWYESGLMLGVKPPHDLWVAYQQGERDALPYEIDGLVVRVNDIAQQLSLGETNGRPAGAVAFKFSPITRETVATGRIDQVGGTGRITPVAVFKPIRILGTEIERASLYNQKYVELIGFDVGAKILVGRANDVIPRVFSVIGSTGKISAPPTNCPECGADTERDGEYIVCTNTGECPAQTEGRIKSWIKELGIFEWGPGLIEKVVAAKLVKTVPDLYRLTQRQVGELDRMGGVSAKNAIEQLWKVNPMPLEAFLGGLSIPLCATSTIQLVMGAGYNTLDKIRSVTKEQLHGIPGVGPKRSEALRKWLDKYDDILLEMLDVGLVVRDKVQGTLTDKSVCFTGKSTLKRAELENLAKAAGGVVKTSVGKGLTYLVMADPSSTSTKAEAARKSGTTCISEEAFVKMARGI